MKTTCKIILPSVLQYLTIGLILLFSANALHEMIHLKLLTLLGGDGYIVLKGSMAEIVITVMPSNGYVVASAGLIVAMIYSLIAYVGYRRKFTELYASLLPTLTAQLGYGIYETIFWELNTPEFYTWATIVAVTSTLIGFFASVYLLYKSLKQKLSLSFSVNLGYPQGC